MMLVIMTQMMMLKKIKEIWKILYVLIILFHLCNCFIDSNDNILFEKPAFQTSTTNDSYLAKYAVEISNDPVEKYSKTYIMGAFSFWYADLMGFYSITEICLLNMNEKGLTEKRIDIETLK